MPRSGLTIKNRTATILQWPLTGQKLCTVEGLSGPPKGCLPVNLSLDCNETARKLLLEEPGKRLLSVIGTIKINFILTFTNKVVQPKAPVKRVPFTGAFVFCEIELLN